VAPHFKRASARMKKSLAFLSLALVQCIALRAADAIRLEFDFAQSDHGFLAGFADYLQNGDPSYYQLTNSWQARPTNLGGSSALFISGFNHSDDLFMFWKKRITGLPPNTSVVLTMEIELASKYAEGLVGAGGAPGEGVTVKAGAVEFEPQAVLEPLEGEGWLRMNLDKGNQTVGGTDMSVIGNVAKPDDGNENYVLLMRHQHGQPLTTRTASDGSLWLIFGTDSGFESITRWSVLRHILPLPILRYPHRGCSIFTFRPHFSHSEERRNVSAEARASTMKRRLSRTIDRGRPRPNGRVDGL
jgi:hypothetical protein